VAEAIRAKGGKAVSAELHLGELEHHDKVLAMIEKEFGRLDVLEGAFDKTIEVNTRGPYFLSTKAFKMLKADGGGSIVNVASIDGLQPAEFRVIYGMSKAALIAMTKGLAKEYSQHGVRVNALLPGFTDTKLASALKDNPAMDLYVKMNLAIKRMAQPEEMVGAVLYMASDEASYYTGQNMIVDGGAVI